MAGAEHLLAGVAHPHRPSVLLRKDLEALLNRHCAENKSDTPDFILAEYLMGCLKAFDIAVASREAWYGRRPPLVLSGSPDDPGEILDHIAGGTE